MKECLFLLFLFFFEFTSFGQYVKVRNELNQVLPLCTVSFDKTEYVNTNSNGIANLPKFVDSIEVSCIGYKNKRIFHLKDKLFSKDTLNVILEKKVNTEETIKVVALSQTLTLGNTDLHKKNIPSAFGKDWIRVVKIKNPKKIIQLESFYIHFSNVSTKNIPFRIRIYNGDTLGLPFNDLIDTSIIIKNYKVGKWEKIDLKEYNIRIKDSVFFIGVEIIDYALKDINVNGSKIAFQISQSNFTISKNEYFYIPFKGWRQFDYINQFKKENKYYNPAIYVKVKASK